MTFLKTAGIVTAILGIGFLIVVESEKIPIYHSETDSGVSRQADDATKQKLLKMYSEIPLYFIENDGLMGENVRFYERGRGHATFFTNEEVYFSFYDAPQPLIPGQSERSTKASWIRLTMLGASNDSKITGEGSLKGKINNLMGNNPKKWKTHIPAFQAVRYTEVYPGIDIKFYGNNHELEYDIIVKPGADPAQVQFSYEGIDSLKATDEGGLEIGLREGKLFQSKPFIYQMINGKQVEVSGKFKLDHTQPIRADSQKHVYGFEVASYDKGYPLVIDPTLAYATYLGGSDLDFGYKITVDSSGNAYITGYTYSFDFPTIPGVIRPFYNGGVYDAFVTKLDTTGSNLIYSTYLGGSGDDYGQDITLDASGNTYVTGYTDSANFPTTPTALYMSHNGGFYDAFLIKLDPTGSLLVYATYLGGNGVDGANAVAVDSSGHAYVTGYTASTNFPATSGAFEPLYNGGNHDIFVAKLNDTGSSLVYSTYLGGSGSDYGSGIALDVLGNTYVTGYTDSTDFPTTPGVFDNSYNGESDAFALKLNTTATGSDSMIYSTYLGGSFSDVGNEIAVDTSSNAYITGFTNSPNFPATTSAFDGTYNGQDDVFVTKFNPAGTSITYSTYLGGAEPDMGYGITVQGSRIAYLTGGTGSFDFPTLAGAFDPSYNGAQDAFVVKLDTTANGQGSLIYSSFLGGNIYENSFGIATDVSGNVYVVGYVVGDSPSADFPVTPEAYDQTLDGFSDTFVVKFPSSKLINISTRGPVLASPNLMHGGFIISGNSPKMVLIRGRGRSMSGAPFFVPGTLANPKIQLYSGSTVIAQNDNWQTTDPLCFSPATSCGNASQITATGKDPCIPHPGQTTPPPGCAQEAAILVTLPPGGYTVIMSGVNNTAGVGLVEVFDLDTSTLSKLINISTRGFVQTFPNLMHGGFIIGGGTGPKTVLIRARGPSMAGAPFFVPGTLANPKIQLYSGSTVIAQNDNWQTTDPLCLSPAVSCGNTAQITATGKDPCIPHPGQTTPPPGCAQEAAILVALPPGGYTMIMSGINAGTGVGLVEVFEMP